MCYNVKPFLAIIPKGVFGFIIRPQFSSVRHGHVSIMLYFSWSFNQRAGGKRAAPNSRTFFQNTLLHFTDISSLSIAVTWICCCLHLTWAVLLTHTFINVICEDQLANLIGLRDSLIVFTRFLGLFVPVSFLSPLVTVCFKTWVISGSESS